MPFVEGQPPEIINRLRASLGAPQEAPAVAVLEFTAPAPPPPPPPPVALLFEPAEEKVTLIPIPLVERIGPDMSLPSIPRLTRAIALPAAAANAHPIFAAALGVESGPASATEASIGAYASPIEEEPRLPALKLAEHPVSWRNFGMILPPVRSSGLLEAVQFEVPRLLDRKPLMNASQRDDTPNAEALVAGDRIGVLPAMHVPVPLPMPHPGDNPDLHPLDAPALRRPEIRFGLPALPSTQE